MSNLDFYTQNCIDNRARINKSLMEKEKSKQRDNLFYLIISFFALSLMLVVIILNTFVFFIADVEGRSMYPTLEGGDKLFTNRCKEPEVNSIVTIKRENNDGTYELWIKRVIALGRCTVKIEDGKVYVDGKLKDEPYIKQGVMTESIKDGVNYGYDLVEWELEEDEMFFLGDNRTKGGSMDSRAVGPCKKSDVVGVVEKWSLKFNELF